MERAVIHSDLKKQEIQPQLLLKKYLALLKEDIKEMLPVGSLQEATCPVTGEREVQESFWKMDMHYLVSRTYGNIYLSPRPAMDVLKAFYRESDAREFWLNKLWPKTEVVRLEKIILPQLEWAQGFISQYFSGRKLCMAEYLPNHWGYYISATDLFPESDYKLVESLFDPSTAREKVSDSEMTNEVDDNSLDVVFLFESMDRSVEPFVILQKVFNSLKPGGLCFITCLLSSGFEVQVLGRESEIFVPPERMNLFSYEGMNALVEKVGGFEILEFSTPGVLEIPNVIKQLDQMNDTAFFRYILKQRQDEELISSFQDFLQLNRLGTFGRLVLRKL